MDVPHLLRLRLTHRETNFELPLSVLTYKVSAEAPRSSADAPLVSSFGQHLPP